MYLAVELDIPIDTVMFIAIAVCIVVIFKIIRKLHMLMGQETHAQAIHYHRGHRLYLGGFIEIQNGVKQRKGTDYEVRDNQRCM